MWIVLPVPGNLFLVAEPDENDNDILIPLRDCNAVVVEFLSVESAEYVRDQLNTPTNVPFPHLNASVRWSEWADRMREKVEKSF